jgi:hypothetical protein
VDERSELPDKMVANCFCVRSKPSTSSANNSFNGTLQLERFLGALGVGHVDCSERETAALAWLSFNLDSGSQPTITKGAHHA